MRCLAQCFDFVALLLYLDCQKSNNKQRTIMVKNIFMVSLMMIIITTAATDAMAQNKKHHRGMRHHQIESAIVTDTETTTNSVPEVAMSDTANIQLHHRGHRHHRGINNTDCAKYGAGVPMRNGHRWGKRMPKDFKAGMQKFSEGQELAMLPNGSYSIEKDGKQYFFYHGAKIEMIVEKESVKYKVVEIMAPKHHHGGRHVNPADSLAETQS